MDDGYGDDFERTGSAYRAVGEGLSGAWSQTARGVAGRGRQMGGGGGAGSPQIAAPGAGGGPG